MEGRNEMNGGKEGRKAHVMEGNKKSERNSMERSETQKRNLN
jgi:hypothetical protein